MRIRAARVPPEKKRHTDRKLLALHLEAAGSGLFKENFLFVHLRHREGLTSIFITEIEVWEHVLAGVKQDESCIQVEYLQSCEKVVTCVKQKAGFASVHK